VEKEETSLEDGQGFKAEEQAVIQFEWYQKDGLAYVEFIATLDGDVLVKWQIPTALGYDARKEMWVQFRREAWSMVE
jgi:hypothetical protein